MNSDPVVILAARRTPVGAFQGAFATVTAPQLGSVAIKAALADSGVAASQIDEVIMGCVLSAGIGQAPARQAALGGGIPASIPATTVNKMCGSAMRAVMLASDQILAGSANIAVAGGIESMTNAPYLLPKARAGYRMGHQEVLDHMFYDGLQSPWDGQLMGCFAEATSEKYEFTRKAQDDFAAESVRRALAAVTNGSFTAEVAPVTTKTRKGEVVVDKDETPFTLDIDKIPTLKPAFKKDGTVTAMQKLLRQLDWQPKDVDLYEINEAFAAVPMAAMKDLGLDHQKVNVNGGACALGHPIGATGARILTTLLYALRARGKKRGIASLCIGGGEATAIAIELM